MILLSIIIPVYNVEKYLQKCLESIIFQLTIEEELIILNDGSTDNSKKICEKYKGENIKFIDKENEGCSITRNKGVEIAKGKYVWFIDSDDFIEDNSIKEIRKIINKEEVDVILFGCNKLEGLETKKFIPSRENYTKYTIYEEPDIFNGVCTKIYKASIIKEKGIKFNPISQMGEDLVFNFKYFFYANKIQIIKKSFYNYLDTGGATTNLDKRIGIYYSFDEVVDFFKKNNSFDKMKIILKEYYKLHAVKIPYNFIMYQATKQEFDKKIEINKIRNEMKKRKDLFNSNFYFLQLVYTLKMKIYFIRPFYKKILKLIKEKER